MINMTTCCAEVLSPKKVVSFDEKNVARIYRLDKNTAAQTTPNTERKHVQQRELIYFIIQVWIEGIFSREGQTRTQSSCLAICAFSRDFQTRT